MLGLSQTLNSFFEWLGIVKNIHQSMNPPQHIRMSVVGSSIDDCLRQLEKKAGLPEGDLSVTGEPMEVVTWPVPKKGLVHTVVSKTSEIWRSKNSGYISGDVFESAGPNMLSSKDLNKLSSLSSAAIRIADSVSFYGKLHLSKNCPGVYYKGVCTTCGNLSR